MPDALNQAHYLFHLGSNTPIRLCLFPFGPRTVLHALSTLRRSNTGTQRWVERSLGSSDYWDVDNRAALPKLDLVGDLPATVMGRARPAGLVGELHRRGV